MASIRPLADKHDVHRRMRSDLEAPIKGTILCDGFCSAGGRARRGGVVAFDGARSCPQAPPTDARRSEPAAEAEVDFHDLRVVLWTSRPNGGVHPAVVLLGARSDWALLTQAQEAFLEATCAHLNGWAAALAETQMRRFRNALHQDCTTSRPRFGG